LRDTEFGTEHVKTDVRACGLLADDPAAPGTFRFGHKSFMEYLVASVIAERIQNKKSEKASAILKATYLQIEDILLLPVAIDFLSELLVGITDDKAEDNRAQEVSIAKRLFKTILSPNTYQALMIRPAVFSESLMFGLGRKALPSRRLFLRLSFMMFPMFIIILPLSLMMKRFMNTSSVPYTSDISYEIILAACATMPMTLWMMFFMSSATVRRKLHLWSHLCKRLGVKDTILHEIVGTSVIPRLRAQPFDYDYRVYSFSDTEAEVVKENKSEDTA
jgi:hypothetical protein